jgi:hypothetical protein
MDAFCCKRRATYNYKIPHEEIYVNSIFPLARALLRIPDLNRANIYIDGHTDKKYWKQARGIFRKTVNGGAILHSTKTNLPDARDYLSIIERKIEILTHRLL